MLVSGMIDLVLAGLILAGLPGTALIDMARARRSG
jgi:hypothetical protein